MPAVAQEVWLALGYAAFLALAAWALMRWARAAGRAVNNDQSGSPPWPHWEASRFHRVVAGLLLAVAALVLAVAAVRHPALPEAALLGTGLLAVALPARRILPVRPRQGSTQRHSGEA